MPARHPRRARVVLPMLSCAWLSSSLLACGASATPIEPAPMSPPAPVIARADESPPMPAPPLGKLPTQVSPLRYRLDLTIVPSEPGFSGRVAIDLRVDQPTAHIFLHADGLADVQAELHDEVGRAVPVRFATVAEGVAVLRTPQPLEPGAYTASIRYVAPFDRQLRGLYRVDAEGQSYAFTQFEAIAARMAFPCFDEPRFKTPFDVSITARAEHRVIANTRERSVESLADGMKRVTFATTEPLPTYLLAFAVGALDVVDAPALTPNDVRTQPVPFRGVAIAGKGKDLAYALEHTPAMVAALERYFGIAYPYDKLDVIAVPDFAAGAMENAGAITFREHLLLLDATRATEGQRRGFAYVMAHELAHQWFGNLVTMPWWDDIWLNEAFATWMGHRVVHGLHPEQHSDIELLSSVHHAMAQDSLQSARVIRQPVDTSHDILNAFDGITYQKGGGVLEMFERYLGAETFAAGLRAYMKAHRFGSATADDLVGALSEAAGHDLQPVVDSFLTQAGVPMLSTRLACQTQPRLHVTQSRYVPLGSSVASDRLWHVPLCVRWGVGNRVEQTCALITKAQDEVVLPTCPAWYLPNADAAGYFRFALAADDREALTTRGLRHLNAREQLAWADALSSAFASGALDATGLFASAATLVRQAERLVVTAPIGWLTFAREHVDVEAQTRVQALGRSLYGAWLKRLGWQPRPQDDGETGLLRAQVIGFMALEAEDPAVRARARQLAHAYLGFGTDGQLHPEVVAADLVDVVLSVAVRDGDVAFFDHAEHTLHQSADALLRERLLAAIGATRDPALAARALALALDSRVRVNEALTPLSRQLRDPTRRDAAWNWLSEHMDAVIARVGSARGGRMPWLGAVFCDAQGVDRVRALFEPRLAQLQGGPRNLAGALEAITLCAAKVQTHGPSLSARFAVGAR